MTTERLELGAAGEELAADYLIDSGLTVLEQNWRCADGEVDLIAFDPDHETVVFVEVKTRSGLGFGLPEEAVTPRKQARLRRLAMRWLQEQDAYFLNVRFDVVSILAKRGYLPTISHFPGAF